jgi:SepF-like predicted cell division protein (DUF552 family)
LAEFEVRCGKSCLLISYLLVSIKAHSSVEADAFAKHTCEIHVDVRQKIVINKGYKALADLRRTFVEFEEGDIVMVHITHVRY